MYKIIKKIFKLILFCISIFGATVWLLIFQEQFSWAKFSEQEARNIFDREKFFLDFEKFFSHGKKFIGFESQVLFLDEQKKIISKKNFTRQKENFDRPFLLASMSKPITALLIFELVESNQLQLNSTLCEHLTINCSEAAKKITLTHLLNHRAGIPRSSFESFGFFNELLRSKTQKSRDLEGLKIFSSTDKIGEYRYSNLGYRLLSYLLEQKYGSDFKTILNARLAKHHGLKSFALKEKSEDKYESYYNFGINRHLSFSLSDRYLSVPIVPAGDGAIVASLSDLQKLSTKLLNRNFFRKDSTHALFFANSELKYENGFVRGQDQAKNQYFFHNGSYFGAHTFWYLFPEKKMAIAMLSSSGMIRNDGEKFIEASYNLIEGRTYLRPDFLRNLPKIEIF